MWKVLMLHKHASQQVMFLPHARRRAGISGPKREINSGGQLDRK
jgi:hypothetical protein